MEYSFYSFYIFSQQYNYSLKKEFSTAGHLVLKFGLALLVTFMTAAQPLFTTNEYAKYSIRGGNPVQIGESAQSAQES